MNVYHFVTAVQYMHILSRTSYLWLLVKQKANISLDK